MIDKQNTSVRVCVDMGDLIYSTLFLGILNVEKILIDGGCGTVKFNWKSAEFLLPFLEIQPQLKGKIELYNNNHYDFSYADHPQNTQVVVGTNLTNYHASKFNLVDDVRIHKPWLSCPVSHDSKITKKKVVINRTHRYHGNVNFYYDYLKYYHISELVFLGLQEEYDSFNRDFGNPNIDFIQTSCCIELATIINSIPTFIGNQSLICSIATGLGKNAFIECCPVAANYIFNRQNIKYF